MKLHSLHKIIAKSKKRLGRGPGSGKGKHTVGRGNKGQKARSKVAIWFEGGQLPLIRRTPFIRGKKRFNKLSPKPITLSLSDLNKFPQNSIVNKTTTTKILKLNPKKVSTRGLKILNKGKVSRKLTVNLTASKKAAQAIKDAGGKIVVQ